MAWLCMALTKMTMPGSQCLRVPEAFLGTTHPCPFSVSSMALQSLASRSVLCISHGL